MAGLFFYLASDPVQGFCFARMQYSHTQAFTARFAVLMQLYHPCHKTAHMALQWHFLRLRPFNRPRYQTDKSGYNTTCATLEGIHAPGRAQQIPDTTATPGRCTGQHRPHIIIRYIGGQTMPAAAGQLLPSADRWQVLHPAHPLMGQRLRLSIWQGSARRGLDTSHARRLAVWHHPPGGAAKRQERGGRRGTIGGSRRISFRAFAR